MSSILIGRCPIDIKNRFYTLESIQQRTPEAVSSERMLACNSNYKTDVEEKLFLPRASRSLKSSTKSSSSSDSTATSSESLETNRPLLTSDSFDNFNFSESLKSCSFSAPYMSKEVQSNSVRIEGDIMTTDGRILKQVPGHSYLFYEENHSAIQAIFGEILRK